MLYCKTILFLAEAGISGQLPTWGLFIAQVGFPIVMTMLLMWFIDRRLERFRNSLDSLTKMIGTWILATELMPKVVKAQTEEIVRKIDENNK